MHNLMSFGLYYYYFLLKKLANINKILNMYWPLIGLFNIFKTRKKDQGISTRREQKVSWRLFLITTVPETDTGSLVENTKA